MEKVYQVITDRIIALLEAGTIPWRRPWNGSAGYPRSLVSGKEYRGVNVFILASAGFSSPYFLSFRQAKERGGNVKKGEHGFPVIYWNWFEKTDSETGEKRKLPFLRYYTVFNVQQCENVKYPETATDKKPFEPIQACEKIVQEMLNRPAIELGKGIACYFPSRDLVSMPAPESFDRPEAYYSTLFHELVHSTGHESRLDRKGITERHSFGDSDYSKEELVAEMGAAFLCGHTGIEKPVLENSAAYIASWLARLRKDNRLVVQSAAQGQKAADFILGRKWEEKEGSE